MNSRSNKLSDKSLTDVSGMFKGRILSRLNLEYRYAVFNSDVECLKKQWCSGTFFGIINEQLRLT